MLLYAAWDETTKIGRVQKYWSIIVPYSTHIASLVLLGDLGRGHNNMKRATAERQLQLKHRERS